MSLDPVVFTEAGAVFAHSRDVADYFEKRHDHVLRDIDNLIEQEPSLAQGRLPNFGESFVEAETGNGTKRRFRAYRMTRDGFGLLAMGFTGAAALRWKLRYIEAFNRMEATLRQPAPDLSDPVVLMRLLTEHAGKRIEAEHRATEAEAVAEEMRPQVQALERIALSDGSLCITDAAKTLQVRPKTLFTHLRARGWIYSRQGSSEIAYQDKLASGLLEHKTTTVHRTDGSEKTVTQVRVTPKGLTRLARELTPAQQPFGLVGAATHGASS